MGGAACFAHFSAVLCCSASTQQAAVQRASGTRVAQKGSSSRCTHLLPHAALAGFVLLHTVPLLLGGGDAAREGQPSEPEAAATVASILSAISCRQAPIRQAPRGVPGARQPQHPWPSAYSSATVCVSTPLASAACQPLSMGISTGPLARLHAGASTVADGRNVRVKRTHEASSPASDRFSFTCSLLVCSGTAVAQHGLVR